jgi:hypothetical protein
MTLKGWRSPSHANCPTQASICRVCCACACVCMYVRMCAKCACVCVCVRVWVCVPCCPKDAAMLCWRRCENVLQLLFPYRLREQGRCEHCDQVGHTTALCASCLRSHTPQALQANTYYIPQGSRPSKRLRVIKIYLNYHSTKKLALIKSELRYSCLHGQP